MGDTTGNGSNTSSSSTSNTARFLRDVVSEPMRLAPGSTLYDGRFTIKQWLGSGGMGVVYKAFDNDNKTYIALKTLPRKDDPSNVYRFKQEFRALRNVVHPNLVVLHEFFNEQDRWFFTMELVPGVTLLRHLGPNPNERNLRQAFTQLARGIRAIHEAGWLHRDLKPTNVLVTPAGVVKILDFGLVIDQKEGGVGQTVVGGGISGTPEYMAPEQCAGKPASRASDWYAFGVMLFQELTGQLPFEGKRHEVLTRKQKEDAPRPSSISEDVPKVLDELVYQLLQRSEDARPDWQQIMQVLLPDGEQPDFPILQEEVMFVGRDKELEALQEAFDATEKDKGVTVVVFIHGVSGVGKTTLVEHFLSGLQQQNEAVVITGRCYEGESVPFKTVDSLIDALSRYLKKLPPERAASLLPKHVNALAQLFPALQRLDIIRKHKQRRPLPRDPNELRRVAFSAFKELLTRIAEQDPLVLYIDDLQWSDIDGAKLLRSALSGPEPPPILLIGSYRSGEVATSDGLNTLRKGIDQLEEAEVREIELGELSDEEAHKLARDLLPEKIQDRAARIAREAQGSPFLIKELARDAATGQLHDEQLSLENAFKRRVDELNDAERKVFEAICVSARPIDQSLLRAVTNNGDVITPLRRLQADHLVRHVASGASSKVTIYHDSIREKIVEVMDPEHLKSWHGRLARAIEVSDNPDLEALTEHWLGAGYDLKAGTWAVKAADHAAETLAFEDAARHYQIALELNPGDRENQRKLQTRRGIALSNAGRGLLAARAFMRAVEGAQPKEESELRYLAARQLVISGHLNEGMQEIGKVLRTVGLKLHSRPLTSTIELLVNRVWIRLHGLDFRERHANEVSKEKLLKLRACATLDQGFGVADTLQASAFSASRLRLALQSGVVEEVARAMAADAIFRSVDGVHNHSIVEELLKQAQKLSERNKDPEVSAYVQYGKGVSACCLGELPDSVQYLKRAEKMFIEQCTGVTYNIDLINAFLGLSFCFLGSWQELQQHWDACIKNGRERDDLFLLATQRTWEQGTYRWLAVDRVDEAREQLSRGLAEWRPWQKFDTQRFGAIFEALIELYAGNYQRAFDIAKEVSQRLFNSSFYRVQYLRVRARLYLAHAALASASISPDRKPLLKIASQQAHELAKEKHPMAEPFVPYIKGCRSHLMGDEESAVWLLREAAKAFTEAEYKLYAAATKRRLGRLIGGDEGRVLVVKADQTMKEEAVVNPERVTAMLAPGFPD